MITLRSPCCGYNLAWCVELKVDDLWSCSHKLESVSLRKCPHDHWHTTKAHLSALTVASICRSFTYKMAAKTGRHRYGTKLHHCHPVHTSGLEIGSDRSGRARIKFCKEEVEYGKNGKNLCLTAPSRPPRSRQSRPIFSSSCFFAFCEISSSRRPARWRHRAVTSLWRHAQRDRRHSRLPAMTSRARGLMTHCSFPSSSNDQNSRRNLPYISNSNA